jgi:chemotaxis protein CheX
MDQKIIDIFTATTKEVVSQMALAEVKPIDVSADEDKPVSSFISSSIGLVGDMKFTFTVGFDKDAIHNLHRVLFPDEEKLSLSSLGDLVGEMSNMICGNAKGILAADGKQLDSSIPSVVIGDRSYIHKSADTRMYVLPFYIGDATMFIELNIQVSPEQ